MTKRQYRLAVFMLAVIMLLSAQGVVGQAPVFCTVGSKHPSACVAFASTSVTDYVALAEFRFFSEVFPDENSATEEVSAFNEVGEWQQVVESGYVFGDQHIAILSWDRDDPERISGTVVFRIGNAVAGWNATGNSIEPFKILHDIYSKMELESQMPSSIQEQVLNLLPDISHLPPGFKWSDDDIRIPEWASDATPFTSVDDDPTIEELEATIVSLEQQLEQPMETPESATQTSGTGPIEILSITTKDAGIGDGSIYAYVEVINRSNREYSYMGIEGTCRNSSGGIVGTGFGNTLNVAPESTVVITMIFLQVPSCTEVQVQFDSLTDLVN